MTPTYSNGPAHRPTSPRFARWGRGRAVTKRAVLWLGLKCDIRCKFCYDERLAASQKVWLPFGELALALHDMRYRYENEFVDFMGGEPTLHPQIFDIVRYARDLGLLPTCITHGMHLGQVGIVERFKDAGIHDFLVSVHAIGKRLDAIHGNGKGSFAKQLAALHQIRAANIPIRFNVTMIRDNMDQLPQIARLCSDVGGSVINFLTYNPYFEWSTAPNIPFQAKHTDITPFLKEAIDVCNELGIEANVRYMPICQMQGYEVHVYTGFQLPFDPHEWDYNSWYKQTGGREDERWYAEAAASQRLRHSYFYPEPCTRCAVMSICDGLHSQYHERWAAEELHPYGGTPITDPKHFVDDQVKMEYTSIGPPADGPQQPTVERVPLTQFTGHFGTRAGARDPGVL